MPRQKLPSSQRKLTSFRFSSSKAFPGRYNLQYVFHGPLWIFRMATTHHYNTPGDEYFYNVFFIYLQCSFSGIYLEYFQLNLSFSFSTTVTLFPKSQILWCKYFTVRFSVPFPKYLHCAHDETRTINRSTQVTQAQYYMITSIMNCQL